MAYEYEINELGKEESWRMFRIIGELVEGFDRLSDVQKAVTIYGSARIQPEDPLYHQTEEVARQLGEHGYSIITGGGPGVMEAANKGAAAAGILSVGLNVELPEAQKSNTYATRSITFKHFFARKIMLVKYAAAFVIMPGGLGTLDELTEVLTLMQTHKIKPFPVILFGCDFWEGFLAWLRGSVLTKQYISEGDLDLLRVCAEPADVVETVDKWYAGHAVIGRRALLP